MTWPYLWHPSSCSGVLEVDGAHAFRLSGTVQCVLLPAAFRVSQVRDSCSARWWMFITKIHSGGLLTGTGCPFWHEVMIRRQHGAVREMCSVLVRSLEMFQEEVGKSL